MKKINLMKVFLISICGFVFLINPLDVFGVTQSDIDKLDTFTTSWTTAFDNMHDCTADEYNKCIANESYCTKTCGNFECKLNCISEGDKCSDYVNRILIKYEECSEKYNNILEKMPMDVDVFENYYCDANKIFVDCMENFNGLCNVSWPRKCYIEDSNNGNKLNDEEDKNNNKVLNNKLIGLPVDPSISTVPCIGETPQNAMLCPDDGKEIFYYTEKKLVSSCSVPEGSEPKCEYICKTKLLNNGTCKEVGFFEKILNWISNLF